MGVMGETDNDLLYISIASFPKTFSLFAKNSVIPIVLSPKVSNLFIGQLINPAILFFLQDQLRP